MHNCFLVRRMCRRICVSLLLGLFLAPVSDTKEKSYHYESTVVRCSRDNSLPDWTSCSMIRGTEWGLAGKGCLQEFRPELKIIRLLCPTGCPRADSAEITHKIPSDNHICLKSINYGLERRAKDFYLWRSGACSNESMSFSILCGVPANIVPFEISTKTDPLYRLL